MPKGSSQIVLGSQSPRRYELLAQIVDPGRIAVLPPRSSEEPAFDGLTAWNDIERQLRAIARMKCDDVLAQLKTAEDREFAAVVAADTVVVVGNADRLTVLGKPPETESWPQTVRQWFREHYIGRTHRVATALCVASPAGEIVERVVQTQVGFRTEGGRWLDWYLSTGEPLDKAGGYAIQQAGSIFVDKVEGSLSNVIGLPLEALLEVLEQFGNVDRQPPAR